MGASAALLLAAVLSQPFQMSCLMQDFHEANVAVSAEKQSFLSAPVRRLLTFSSEEELEPAPVVYTDRGTFNWEVFDTPLLEAESIEGCDLHVYLKSSLYLKGVARGCMVYMQSGEARARLAKRAEDVGGGRSHKDSLGAILKRYLRVLSDSDRGVAGRNVDEDEETSTASFTNALLLCSFLERILYDIFYHLQDANKEIAAKENPPALLRDLLQHPVMKAALPRGASDWMSMIFHPKCLNLRNVRASSLWLCTAS
eukprot:750828-Hanusia_phi.AAC.1